MFVPAYIYTLHIFCLSFFADLLSSFLFWVLDHFDKAVLEFIVPVAEDGIEVAPLTGDFDLLLIKVGYNVGVCQHFAHLFVGEVIEELFHLHVGSIATAFSVESCNRCLSPIAHIYLVG